LRELNQEELKMMKEIEELESQVESQKEHLKHQQEI